MQIIQIMTRKLKESCLNVLDAVGTCLNSRVRSNNVGTAVLQKIGESSEFERISGFVGPVGTVGQEIGVLEKSLTSRWSVIAREAKQSHKTAALPSSARSDDRKEVSDAD